MSINKPKTFAVFNDLNGSYKPLSVLLANIDNFDHFIFIGNFVPKNTFVESIWDKHVKFLRLLLKKKKENPKKIQLIIGSDDLMCFEKYNDKLHQTADYKKELIDLMNENSHLFKIAYCNGYNIFSYNGVSNKFVDTILDESIPKGVTRITRACEVMNEMFQKGDSRIGWTSYPIDEEGGNFAKQSPLLVNSQSIRTYPLFIVDQFVNKKFASPDSFRDSNNNTSVMFLPGITAGLFHVVANSSVYSLPI